MVVVPVVDCDPMASSKSGVEILFQAGVTAILMITCKPLTDRGLIGLFALMLLLCLVIVVLMLLWQIKTGKITLSMENNATSLNRLLFLSFAIAALMQVVNTKCGSNVRKIIALVALIGAVKALFQGCDHLGFAQFVVGTVLAQGGMMFLFVANLFFGLFSLMFDVAMSFYIHDMRTALELESPSFPSRWSSRRSFSALMSYCWYHVKLALLRLGEAIEHYSDSVLSQNTLEFLELIRRMNTYISSRQPPDGRGGGSGISSLYVLSQTLWESFLATRNFEDLQECIDCLTEALRNCPVDEDPASSASRDCDLDPQVNRYTHMSYSLARILYSGFVETGRLELLDIAVSHLREVLSTLSSNHLFRPSFMLYLGSTYAVYNRQNDLETAIGLYSAVLALPSLQPSERLSALVFKVDGMHALSRVSLTKERVVDDDELMETCRRLRDELDINRSPPGRLAANAWMRLCEVYGGRSPEETEDAIECGRRALALCGSGGGEKDGVRFTALLRLSRVLRHPVRRELASLDELDEARKCLKTAQRYLSGEDDPRWALVWIELARAYALPQGIDKVVSLLERSTQHASALIRVRLDAADMWTEVALKFRHSSTLRAYETYIDLLDNYLMSMPSLDEQRATLASIENLSTLGMDAAAAAIDVGEYEKAIELFERGRGILWARMRAYRYSLLDIPGAESELAQRLFRINRELETHAVSAQIRAQAYQPDIDLRSLRRNPIEPITLNEHSIHRSISRQRELLREREEVIRKVPGFEHFLQPTPFDKLREAASEGPVVIVNVSHIRCDAIIIPPAPESLCVVPLSQQLFTRNPSLANDMEHAVRAHRSRRRVSREAGVQLRLDIELDCEETHDVIAAFLNDLWELVAVPVKEKLDVMTVSGSRIWWCPTAHLFSLPIHAAGIASQDMYFCDYYVSSYTASLSALISARKNSSRPELVNIPKPNTLLLVAQADASIPDVRTEIACIQSLSSKHAEVKSCIDANASPSNVIASLQTCSWVHFACHGLVNPENPFESYFLLHNHQKLTLIDLMNADLPNAGFAFLAACHSAVGDRRRTPDEGLHLASAMHFIGFRAVVGTLWEMVDEDGPIIAKGFYEYVFRGTGGSSMGGGCVSFRESAAALDRAVRELRERGVPLDRWVNFVHIGA